MAIGQAELTSRGNQEQIGASRDPRRHQSIKGISELNYGQPDSDEALTAYHEAGHAVIAYALGGTVHGVQLGGEADDWLPERFGECRIHWKGVSSRQPPTQWQRRREVLTILAGPVAEMIYSGQPYHPAYFGPAKSDWQLAWELVEPIVSSSAKRTRYLEEITSELYCRMQSDDLWAAIGAVADELLAHEFLERDQLSETLGFWMRAP